MYRTPQMEALGCVSSLVNIGAFVSGVYQGIADAKGTPIDSTVRGLIKYGPIAVNTALGFAASQIIKHDGTLDQMVMSAPGPIDKGCMQGCNSIFFPLGSGAITVGFEYLGYAIGYSMSK